jgi:MazG family protein
MTPTTLRAVMSALLQPETGCPWDLKQDHQSLARYLREEAGEVLEALAAHVPGDPETERHLCEELGDLWLQVVFHAQLAEARGAWDLHSVEAMVVAKLVRRHPHVFGAVAVDGAADVLANWAAIKREERAERGEVAEPRLLDGIPADLSPLDAALEIGRRCAKVGFDWPDLAGVLDKVREELDELQAELPAVTTGTGAGSVVAPAAPSATPDVPAAAPAAPFAAPDAPVVATAAQFATPDAPLVASPASFAAPDAPVAAPTAPFSAPDAPVAAPVVPHAAPSAPDAQSRVEAEFGDVLFSLVQWARHQGIDPDRALRRQMARFQGRFAGVEDFARAHGGWERQAAADLESAWQAAKRMETRP